jgi:hypothetical protein
MIKYCRRNNLLFSDRTSRKHVAWANYIINFNLIVAIKSRAREYVDAYPKFTVFESKLAVIPEDIAVVVRSTERTPLPPF